MPQWGVFGIFIVGLISLSGQASQISAGAHHTCAIQKNEVFCWGANLRGQLGNGKTNLKLTQPTLVDHEFPAPLKAVTAGIAHTCALSKGSVYCWGSNRFGQTGHPNFEIPTLTPHPISLPDEVLGVSAGSWHTCAQTTQDVFCWGNNSRGQIGFGETLPEKTATPKRVVDQQGKFLSFPLKVSAGTSHSCAFFSSGIKCWGWNLFGQLGDNKNSGRQSLSAVRTELIGLGVKGISTGLHHTCSIVENEILCFGKNGFGQLGFSQPKEVHQPRRGENGGQTPDLISVGNSHTCVLQKNQNVYCMGLNRSGQLGVPLSTRMTSTPQLVKGMGGGALILESFDSGARHNCGIFEEKVYCWGSNLHGQLGDGEESGKFSFHPVEVQF